MTWNWWIPKFLKKGSIKQGGNSGMSSVLSLEPFLSNLEANAEANATFMSCVGSFSRIIGKIYPEIRMNGKPTRNHSHIQYLLSNRPNELQNAVNFWEQVGNNYHLNNVAVIYLAWDYSTSPRTLDSLWCIDTSDSSFRIAEKDGKAFFTFSLGDREIVASSEDLAIIVFQPSHDNPYALYNKSLNQVLSAINESYIGMMKDIKSAALIRLIAQYSTKLTDADLKSRGDRMSSILSDLKSSILVVDNAATLTPVPQTAFAGSAMAEELKLFKTDVYDYFGMSEKILDSTATDDEYQSFVEMSVEPFTYQLAIELTNKIFTEKERSLGNEIVVDTGQLFTASQQHRIQSAQILIQSAKYYPNEIRSIMGLSLLDEKDNELINRSDRIDSASGSEDTDQGGNDNGTGKEDKAGA